MLNKFSPLIVLFAFIALWAALPGTHLVMDEGYRLLQASSLKQSISFPVYINYPGAAILGSASAEAVRPLPAHYGKFTEEGLTCFYSPALALLASPFSGKSFLLIPLFSGFFLWLFISKKLELAGFSKLAAGLIPLAGTPLLFYSLGFWSYPLCILLVFTAVKTAESNRPFAAYLFVSLAALFRMEYAIAFLLVFLRQDSRWFKRLLPALPALIILFAGNWILSGGEILGSHVLAGTSEQTLYGNVDTPIAVQKLSAAGKTLFAMVPGRAETIWLIPGMLLWGLWGLALRGKKLGTIAAVTGLSLCLAAVAVWAAGKFAFLDGFSMKHPLMVFPALWLFSVDTLRKSWRELIILLILLLLLLPMHTEGPDWGIRHMFLPLFLVLWNLKPCGKKWLPVVCFGLLITTSALLFLGVNRNRVENLSTLAETGGSAIITTNWIIPGWFTDNMSEGTPVIYTNTAYQLAESISLLRHCNPVVVCLQRDAILAIQILEELGYTSTVEGEVEFGPSLRCILLTPGQL